LAKEICIVTYIFFLLFVNYEPKQTKTLDNLQLLNIC